MKNCCIVLLVLISSCKLNDLVKTVYTYNGISVTRIESNRVSLFYYGSQTEEKLNIHAYIKSDYYRGPDIMEGNLVFDPDGKVTLVKMSNNFEKIGDDSLLNLREFSENIFFIHWEDSIKRNFSNVVRISESSRLEARFNKEYGSKVEVKLIK